MYTLDNHVMSVKDTTGTELKSTVVWHFLAALYLQSTLNPNGLGEIDNTTLKKIPFFSRYRSNSLRATIARTVSSIEKHFNIITYNNKSAGPWWLSNPDDIKIFPSVKHLQEKLQYQPQTVSRLQHHDEKALFLFAQNIVNGDCLLHTGHQKQACLQHYRKAASSNIPLLKTSGKLRLCQALIRLGDFKTAEIELLNTNWQEGGTYAETHIKLLTSRLYRLQSKPDPHKKPIDTSSLPDDVSTALAMTLNAFNIRDSYMLAVAENSRAQTLTRLAHDCLEDLYNALLFRLRAYHYDGIQQAAYNIANSIHQMSRASKVPFRNQDTLAVINRWSEFCEEVCNNFEVGKDTYLNELLQAETLALSPETQAQALAAAKSAYDKSLFNGNRYDQREILDLIEKLSGSS